MATLQGLVNETTNIKDDIVNCYEVVNERLKNKDLSLSIEKIGEVTERIEKLYYPVCIPGSTFECLKSSKTAKTKETAYIKAHAIDITLVIDSILNHDILKKADKIDGVNVKSVIRSPNLTGDIDFNMHLKLVHKNNNGDIYITKEFKHRVTGNMPSTSIPSTISITPGVGDVLEVWIKSTTNDGWLQETTYLNTSFTADLDLR